MEIILSLVKTDCAHCSCKVPYSKVLGVRLCWGADIYSTLDIFLLHHPGRDLEDMINRYAAIPQFEMKLVTVPTWRLLKVTAGRGWRLRLTLIHCVHSRPAGSQSPDICCSCQEKKSLHHPNVNCFIQDERQKAVFSIVGTHDSRNFPHTSVCSSGGGIWCTAVRSRNMQLHLKASLILFIYLI